MRTLDTLRERKNRLAYAVLGAFLLVWFGMVLQPCTMAMEIVSDHDCPHCLEQAVEQPCHVSESSCTYIDSYDYDGRSTSLELEDAFDNIPVVIYTLLVDVRWMVSPDPVYDIGDSTVSILRPPLTLLNCCFLI